MKEALDYCEMCSICEHQQGMEKDVHMNICIQCSKTTCDDCEHKGRCGECADYDLPPNFKIIPMEDRGRKNASIIQVKIHKFYGVGIHYWITMTDLGSKDRQILDGENTDVLDTINMKFPQRQANTIEEAKILIKKALIKYRGKTKTYVRFYGEEGHRWFYKEGD